MIAQADSRKWMACLYNSFLFMEAKIMKMAKKLLAVVLAGVLALSVLTGCGGAVSTKAIAEAMSDTTIAEAMSDKSKEDGVVYRADSELDEKAGQIGEMIRRKEEGDDPGTEPNIYRKIMKIMGEDYADKYVWIAVTTTEGNNVTTQAENLLEDVDKDSNINSAVPNGTSPAAVRSIGTVPITENGVDYLFAVITADAVEDKD